jgi:hypothetical protein
VYEFCVGHARVWSTAQGRFGRPVRLTGVQHPAPGLGCTVDRSDEAIVMAAPYAAPVYDGRSLLPSQPLTELWGVVYTQVVQVDGATRRNILLGERKLLGNRKDWSRFGALSASMRYGMCSWPVDEVTASLEALGLPSDSPLSVLAVELYKNFTPVAQPLAADLGAMRIYRVSQLQAVPDKC